MGALFLECFVLVASWSALIYIFCMCVAVKVWKISFFFISLNKHSWEAKTAMSWCRFCFYWPCIFILSFFLWFAERKGTGRDRSIDDQSSWRPPLFHSILLSWNSLLNSCSFCYPYYYYFVITYVRPDVFTSLCRSFCPLQNLLKI